MSIMFKGQKSWKCGVFNFPKMHPNITKIFALTFKMGQIKKIKGFVILNSI